MTIVTNGNSFQNVKLNRLNGEEIVIDKKRIPGLFMTLAAVLIIGITSIFMINKAIDHKRTIGVSYMTMNNQFYEVINNDIRKVVESHGDNLLVYDPQMDLNRQTDQIRSFIDQNAAGIIINPIDSNALAPLLSEAKSKGIPVIVVDAPLTEDSRAAVTITSDNYQAGVMCAEDVLKHWDKAKILLLEHSQVISASDRIRVFTDTLQSHPGFEIADRAECEGQLELAMPAVEAMLEKHPDADIIMALNDPSAMGALAALEAAGNDHVKIYGVDGSPDVKQQLLRNGQMYATAAQSPSTMGNLAAESLYKLLDQQNVESEIIVSVKLLKKEDCTAESAKGWQ